jgi:transglutaminase-like putative cysteine protease
MRADRRHITLAWGGDFADVVPLRGVLLGGRGQKMTTAVSVIPT